MALFSSYEYDPSTYQGGGGLIDRIIGQLQTQQQYQPAAGFSPAPDQAAPIAVGNYQMPRIGNAQQFAADPASIPQNAQYTQGQVPPPQVSVTSNSVGPTESPGNSFPPAPQQPPLPSILQAPGNGLLDHLNAGFQNFGHGNGLISALINSATGFATGQRLDPQGQQQEILRAQYQSLIPILGEAKARLAVLNPEVGKAMVAQALSGRQYTFTTTPEGTVLRQDAHAGTVEPVYAGAAKPTFGVIGEDDGKKTYGWLDPNKRSITPYNPPGGAEDRGGVAGPDGKIIPYPEGVDRKTFRNEITKINADAAGGKKTEVQAKSEKFGNEMELSERAIKDLEGQGTSLFGKIAGEVPLGNYAQSNAYQKYEQAKNKFITAVLRDQSGAAIGTPEFKRYEKELFPQPGDSMGVIAQKRQMRQAEIEGMKKAAGPGYKSPTAAGGGEVADPLGIR